MSNLVGRLTQRNESRNNAGAAGSPFSSRLNGGKNAVFDCARLNHRPMPNLANLPFWESRRLRPGLRKSLGMQDFGTNILTSQGVALWTSGDMRGRQKRSLTLMLFKRR